MPENEIGTLILNAAIEVHRGLGPGLLESVYEVVLARTLSLRGFLVERQIAVPIVYQDLRFDEGFRADIIVERKVLLEIKSVERISPAHKKQVQTYLRLTGLKLGYLLNFGEAALKDGIIREVAQEEEREHVVAEVVRVHGATELVGDVPERLAQLLLVLLGHADFLLGWALAARRD